MNRYNRRVRTPGPVLFVFIGGYGREYCVRVCGQFEPVQRGIELLQH